MTDTEYIQGMLDNGNNMVDGRRESTVPELGLPCIHDMSGLVHLGFGDFQNECYNFFRVDSPKGTRFYIRIGRD